MGYLKKQNTNTCYSLLKNFIDGAVSTNRQKDQAIMALDQLHKITAGNDGPPAPTIGSPSCQDKPLADPTPLTGYTRSIQKT